MYFLAMEITRRKFASTISFFARRALASPIDMRRLMSLISAIVRPVSVSSAVSFCWQRMISGCRRPMASAYLPLPLASASLQLSSTSLPGNWRRKSARGMRASRTHSCMIARSWATQTIKGTANTLDQAFELLRHQFDRHEQLGQGQPVRQWSACWCDRAFSGPCG